MKKLTKKEQITKIINDFIWQTGFTFRFAKTDDMRTGWDGATYFDRKKIIIRDTTMLFDTLAHELAHVQQMMEFGETHCNSELKGRKKLTKKICELIYDHQKRTDENLEDMRFLGILEDIKKIKDKYCLFK